MLHVIEAELARVRLELTRLEAQAEMLHRLICLNDNQAESGQEMPIVELMPAEVEEQPQDPPAPMQASDEESVPVPVEKGTNCKRWEIGEDIAIAQSGYTKWSEFEKLSRQKMPHRTAGSLYQRYRQLARAGRISGLARMETPDDDEPVIPADHQPPTRVVEADERREVATPPARKKGLSFEEQLARVARGEVGITAVQPVRMPPPEMTLGGVGTGML